jgi:hypothetical protein
MKLLELFYGLELAQGFDGSAEVMAGFRRSGRSVQPEQEAAPSHPIAISRSAPGC